MSTADKPLFNRSEGQPERKMISQQEWVWLVVVAILILLASTIPFLAGYSSQTAELIFPGSAINRMDYAVHMATMHLGERGEWTYRFRFTGEAHQGEYVKLFYIFLGHASRWIGLSIETTFHLGRWLFGFTALVMVYVLFSEAFKNVTVRKVAFLLAVLGSGIGWVQVIAGWQPNAGISPIDFWLMDAYIFFSLLVFPHYMLILTLIIAMVFFYWRYLRSGGLLNLIIPVLAGLGIMAVQPFSLAIGFLGMAGVLLGKWFQESTIQWSDLLPFAVVFSLQLPLLLYNVYVYQFLPVWSGIAKQHVMLSPPPLYYLLGFGLLWPLAIWGGVIAWRKRLGMGLAAIVWILGASILCYLPFSFQRRFIFGITIPIALLAGYGLAQGVLARIPRRGISFSIIFVSFAALTSLYLVSGPTVLLLQSTPDYFEPNSLVMGITWLKEHAAADDIVLASEQTSQLVASRTGLIVYAGHPMETLDYAEKIGEIDRFYSANGVQKLPSEDIGWIIFGPHEGEIGLGRGWTAPSDFREAYKSKGVTIYQRHP